MAEISSAVSSDSQSSIVTEEEQAQARRDLDELKRDLEGWREAFLPIRGLLMWEKPYHPAVIFGVTTLIFSVILFLEPSVMTTIAALGLVITGADFVMPIISPYIFGQRQWTGTEELQFEQTCERILHFRTHLSQFVQGMIILKTERPNIYFLLVMGILLFFAWLGYVVNNLFLTYIVVLSLLMIPGLREKGLLQSVFHEPWQRLKRLIFGRLKVIKNKTQ